MYTLLVTEKSALDSLELSTNANNLSNAICDIDIRHSDINLNFNSLAFLSYLIGQGKLFTNNSELDTRTFNVIKVPNTVPDIKYRLVVLTELNHPLAGNLNVTLFTVEKIYLNSISYFKYSVDYNLFNWYLKKFKDKLPNDTVTRIFVDALRYKHIDT